MKRSRMKLFSVALMLALSFLVLLTHIPFQWKVVCYSVYWIMILFTVFSLMLENRSAQNTMLWIINLVFLPVIGYIFYMYLGQFIKKGALFRSKRMKDRLLLETLQKKGKKADFSNLNSHQLGFARYLDRTTLTNWNTNTQVKILNNGQETFPEMKRRLREAKDFIHMEYYRIRSDRLGHEIIDILLDKAKEGVEVRLLFDAMGSLSFSASDIARMKTAGIKVYPFLPIKLGIYNQKFNFRNHRKIIVVDGKIGFVGGLNIGVEYLGEDERMGFWCDTHVLMKGEAVQTLHSVFLLDWLYVSGEMLLRNERYIKVVPETADGLVHVVATGPDTENMSDHYYSLITSATKSIWIASPYFVPNQAIRTALRIAARKGIDVRIMVPETNDNFLTQYGSQSYFAEALSSGIEIYLYQKGFLHKKIIIIDEDLASIGTANMDMRSFRLNFEVNLFLADTEAIQDLVDNYEEDIENCRKVHPVQFYKRGYDEKVKESFARLFSGLL